MTSGELIPASYVFDAILAGVMTKTAFEQWIQVKKDDAYKRGLRRANESQMTDHKL
jgi:hypothetical protein